MNHYYSDIVLDHFFNPRNCFRMTNPDVIGKSGEPGRGPFMLLYLDLEGDRIQEASYQTYGCGPAIAAGSVLTEKITGKTRDEVRHWTAEAITEELGGLPKSKKHCAALAARALEHALEKWPKPSDR